MKRALRWALVFGLGLTAGGAAVAALWTAWVLTPIAPNAPAVDFAVQPGDSFGSTAHRLEARGLVRSEKVFRALARWRGVDTRLHAGEYELSGAMHPERILEKLTTGDVKTYDVVLPEGLTAEQVAQRLEDAGLTDAEAFLAVARDPEVARELGVQGDTLEGYLFPETYRLPRGLEPEAVARVLVDHFHRAWDRVAARAEALGLSMRECVTLASIIEKETGAPHERPLIAGVFHNRLDRGMRLETDPTVIYGIPHFDGNLRRLHLEDASNPYNTYQITGLPPGPIANPGLDALQAAVAPAETEFLYFVSKNDGTHHFSQSYEEHVNAVNRYQLRRSR